MVLSGFRRLVLVLILLVGSSGCSRGHAGPSSVAQRSGPEEEAKDVVVLVHGLGRTRLSMMPLEWAIEREGYTVLNWGYSSTCCTVAELSRRLAEDLAGEVREQPIPPGGRIHFVGHSLGNIVIRSLLATEPPQNLGRVVMLAPPNGGSLSADRYSRLLGWLLPPLPELTTGQGSTARSLRIPPAVEIGVIAGEHDGKVSVSESHLPGESDHVVVPSAHTFIMIRGDVRRLVLAFLQQGRFS